MLAAAVGFSMAGCAEIESVSAEPYEPAALESTGPSQPAKITSPKRQRAELRSRQRSSELAARSSRFITLRLSMTRRVCRGSSRLLGPRPTPVRR